MTSRLHRLLESLQSDPDPGLRRAWDQTLIFKNVGGIPAVGRPRGDFPWNRGFDLFCLDARGRPTHFCKCRERENELARVETELLEKICAEPDLAGLVPATRGLTEGGLQVQVSAYLEHQPYSEVLTRWPEADWLESMQAILEGAHRISARADGLRPGLAAGGPTFALDVAAAESLDYLKAQRLLTPEVCGQLTALFGACGRMRRWPQHGDLWHGNVLVVEGAYRIVDFETYGRVQVPLFDAFHLLRTTRDLRPPSGQGSPWLTWKDRLSKDAGFRRAVNAIIPSLGREQGLTGAQAVAVFFFYVMDIAAWFHQRIKDHPFARPFVAELAVLPDLLGRQHELRLLLAEPA
jgi:hypothetical protein